MAGLHLGINQRHMRPVDVKRLWRADRYCLGIGTFLVNKHYKKKSEQAQARQAAAMEERNRLIARILEKNDHDSTLKMLAVSEMPEGSNGGQDKS